QNGVFAADMAARGFTGGTDGLDGEWGYFQVCGGGADISRIIGTLGNPHTIVNPGVSIKPYPSGVLSHPSMDALLVVVTENDITPDQVKASGCAPGRTSSNRCDTRSRRRSSKRSSVSRFSCPASCCGGARASGSSP